jgi:signal transduction histidine kinase
MKKPSPAADDLVVTLPRLVHSRRTPAALTALVCLYLTWQLFGWIPGERSVVDAVLFQPVELGGIFAAWRASRGAAGRSAVAWRLIALGLVGQYLGGQVAHYYEWTGQSQYPSLADPLYLSFYPLMLAGLLVMRPAGSDRSKRLRLGLDLATTALGGAAVVWYLIIGPTASAGGQSAVQMAFSIAYPVGDLILIVGLAWLLLRGVPANTRRALRLLAAGLGLFVIGDLLYGYATLHDGFGGGDALNATYYVGLALFILAARSQWTGTADAEAVGDTRASGISWMPYLGVAAGFGVLVVAEASNELIPDGLLAVTASVIAALVSARQLLAQRELVTARQALEVAYTEAQRAAAERERMELELRLAQKLEAVGQLAAGIAHEINTPIQFVGDTGRFLEDAFGDLLPVLDAYAEVRDAARAGSVAPELLERVEAAEEHADLDYLRQRLPSAIARISDGVGRVATIVSAMRTFAHPSAEKGIVDINESIRTTLVVAANEYKYVADVNTDFAPAAEVFCSAGDVNQVILNLVVNAAHAIADADPDSERRGVIDIRTERRDDEFLITIADTGCGIPADVAERVFDPFFTTKDVGRGTGQGLAIARTLVVDRHGGALTFESEPGHGTTFTVSLPVAGVA